MADRPAQPRLRQLRELLQSPDASLAGSLIDPVIHRFAGSLETVATTYAHLAPQCESLTGDLLKILDPPLAESTEPYLDPDVPF